jgi:ABC-type transport system substrate-binding protein
MAIDREKIAAAVTFGIAADGVVPGISGGATESLISTDFNRAKELIAGVDFTGVSKEFTIKHAATEDETKIAEMVSEVWTSLGFTVNTVALGAAQNNVGGTKFLDSAVQTLVKEASFGNRDFDVLGIDWQFYSRDAFVGLAAFTSSMNGCGVDFDANSTRRGITGYNNLNYDSLIASAMGANGDERDELLLLAEKRLCSDAIVCPIIFGETFAFVSSELKNVEIDGLGNVVLTEAELKNYKNYYPKED